MNHYELARKLRVECRYIADCYNSKHEKKLHLPPRKEEYYVWDKIIIDSLHKGALDGFGEFYKRLRRSVN